MKDELYIDIVSKTLISKLSESIARLSGDELSQEINKLLVQELPKLISDEINPSLDNALTGVLKASEKTEKRMIEQLGDMRGRIKESVKEQKALFKETLQGNLKKMESALTLEHNALLKETNNLKDSAKVIQKQTLESLESFIADGVTHRLMATEKSVEKLLESVKSLGEQTEDSAKVQREDLSEVMRSDLKGIVTELNAGLESLQEEMTNLKDRLEGIQDQTMTGSLKDVIEESTEIHLKTAERSEKKMLDELKNLKEQIEAGVSEQQGLLKVFLKGDLGKIGSELTSGLEGLQEEFVQLKEAARGSQNETVEALKGFIEENAADHLREAEKSNEIMRDGFTSIREQVGEDSKEQGNLLKNILHSTKKLSKASASINQDAFVKLEATLKNIQEGIVDEIGKDTEGLKRVEQELKTIRGLLDEGKDGQSYLLDSIFYSVKKLSSAHKENRDVSQKFETQFMGALDELYGHIRRLEEEKEDLFTEMISVAGNDYIKRKQSELEKELKKAKEVAENYKNEKIEVEERLEQMQSLMENVSN